jgi:DNA-binding transcriptional ArsR family regulator
MDTFAALAEPNRRHIIELLASHGQLSASEISKEFQMTAPAISQHLKVLREAQLVDMEKRAQQRIYTINPKKVLEIEQWIQQLKVEWERKFDRLEKLLEKEKRKGGEKNG